MAARLKSRHQDDIKAKIQASQLINRVQNHGLGDLELTPTQLDACKFLLNKLISNAPTQTELSGPDGEPIKHSLRVEFGRDDQVPPEAQTTVSTP